MLAAWALHELGRSTRRRRPKRQVVAAVKSVAAELGNTPAVCRRCYIHPDVMDAHLDGTLGDVLGRKTARTGLTAHEAAVLALLKSTASWSCSDRMSGRLAG